MKQFIPFLKSIQNGQNRFLLESFQRAYAACFEGVSINKDYLLKLAGNDLNKLKSTKQNVNDTLKKEGYETLLPNKENDKVFLATANFLTKLVLQGDTVTPEILKYFHDLITEKNLSKLGSVLTNSDLTASNLTTEIASYNEEKAKTSLSPTEKEEFNRVEVIHDFGDGWKWIIPLNAEGERKGACSIEGKVNAHCGNTPSVQEGDVLYSLRNGDKIGATVIVNEKGYIRESKGKSNSKIALKNHKEHMVWLFNHEHIKGIDDEGSYAPERNIHVSDFLGVDEDVVKHFEGFKPELISEKYDKVVLDLKKRLMNHEITEEDVIEQFKKSRIELFHLKGILGKIPFSEKEIEIMVIKDHLYFIDILQADTHLLTNSVQKALIKRDKENYNQLIQLEKEVESFKMDHPKIDSFAVQTHTGLYKSVPKHVLETLGVAFSTWAITNWVTNYTYAPDSIKVELGVEFAKDLLHSTPGYYSHVPDVLKEKIGVPYAESLLKRSASFYYEMPESIKANLSIEVTEQAILTRPEIYPGVPDSMKEKLGLEFTKALLSKSIRLYKDIPEPMKIALGLGFAKNIVKVYPAMYEFLPQSFMDQMRPDAK